LTIRAPIETELGRPSTALFAWIDERPLGSASLAQVHCPTTRDGRDVVVEGLEPGVRDLVLADLTLVRGLGRILDWLAPHYQPVATIKGLRACTIRELDLAVEAVNGETFAGPLP
jgi:ubiquinone biosynthesis protein